MQANGGKVAFEWPSVCALWNEKQVLMMLKEFNLRFVRTDGCAHGVVAARASEAGSPIKKRWAIATDCVELIEAMEEIQCPGPFVHPHHAICEKSDTVLTGFYPVAFCDVVHNSLSEAVSARVRKEAPVFATMPHLDVAAPISKPIDIEEHIPRDDIFEDTDLWLSREPILDVFDVGGHHEHIGTPGMWCALITKTFHPWEPEARSQEAIDAIGSELGALRERTVWNEDIVYEQEDAKKRFPDAHFSDIFAIVGVKNHESPDVKDHKWKGRVVLGGHAIKDACGSRPVFTGSSTIPSSMTAARFLIALPCAFPSLVLVQTDCIRAYVQAKMTGPKTFISMPRAWWPKHWLRFKKPCVELLCALYGHPKAGDIWGDKLHVILIGFLFEAVEGWPGVYIRGAGTAQLIVIAVYVDDLLILAGEAILKVFIPELREQVEIEDPANISKYIGCHYSVNTTGAAPNRITTVLHDMTDYMISSFRIYEDVTKLKLKKVDTPYAPELPKGQTLMLLEAPGVLGQHAASFLMKLLFAARLAVPHMCCDSEAHTVCDEEEC